MSLLILLNTVRYPNGIIVAAHVNILLMLIVNSKAFADNLTYCIVGLAYNPDFKTKYFFKYYDTALYSTPPTDDDLFEYTPITEILSDSDNIFLPPDTPNVCPGPSDPVRMNLVTVGFVDPNVKSNRW